MKEIFDKHTSDELKRVLDSLPRKVRLVFFTQEHACGACREQEELLRSLDGLSEQLSLEVFDFVADAETARDYGISRVPATAVVSDLDYGIRFYGLTLGYEFTSLLQAVFMVATGNAGLEPELMPLVALIDEPVHLEVMVTLTCPYCPKMVHVAHQLAVVSEHIKADMIEASEYPQLVQRYQVGGVPRTVINEGTGFDGALPAAQVILEILKQVKPAEYERLESALREARGERAAVEASPANEYDVLIVGAGPAAMSAAIYAARKNLAVALIGENAGGQITNTATIENWLGFPRVGGQELAMMFRDHAESYRLAERLHARVESVQRHGDMFTVALSGGDIYRARSVIYCAGKEYRRLGVPGESRFLGHGIAFCATCDAPLYRGKRVAVVGGGNSAFTAARDLLGYADEIHIINISDKFIADPVLQEQVRSAAQVTLHPSMHVREFLGEDKLSAVRLESVDGRDRFDLAVDGVFLEIGLVPNSAPVKALLRLNERGEIPVGRDQSTEVPGLFAAGDVTDEVEKQIIVAAGAGAKAALAAHRYLTSGKDEV